MTRTTYSLRTSMELSTTHCTTPGWSRTSTKARCSPCSRRRPTQPHTRDRLRRCARGAARRTGGVRIAVAQDRQGGRSCAGTASRWVRRSGRATTVWSSPVAAKRAHDGGAGGPLVVADDHGDGRAAAVGGLHLGLHAAPVVGPVGRAPGAAHLVGDRPAPPRPPVVSTTNTSTARVRRRRTRPRRRRPAACGRRRGRSRRRASAGRRAPRRGRRSDRRRRARSGRRRACRRRTRTSCAGSSRGRARAAGSTRYGMPSASRPARTASKCSAARLARGSRRAAVRRRSAAASVAALGVEHAQRVAVERLAALLAERVEAGAKWARSAST